MLLQIAVGTGLIAISILIGALAALLMELAFLRGHGWLMKEPHRPKLVLVVVMVSLGVLAVVTAGVWLWALAYYALGVFGTLEEAVYFSLVSFTTLGYGDVLLHPEWRILGGMSAANGLLIFGLMTALLVDALRQVRLGQFEVRRKNSG